MKTGEKIYRKLNSKIFILILLVVAVISLAYLLAHSYYRTTIEKNDLTRCFIPATKMILENRDLFGDTKWLDREKDCPENPFTYPLFMYIAIIPLSPLPSLFLFLCWFFCNLCCFLLAIKLFTDTIKKCYGLTITIKERLLIYSITSIVFFSSLQFNFVYGQINPVVMLCGVLFIKSYTNKRWLLSAFVLSIGISIKIIPIALIIMFLLNRDIKTLIYTTLCCLFFTFAVPLTMLTPSSVFNYYTHFIETFFVIGSSEHIANIPANTNAMINLPNLLKPLNLFPMQNILLTLIILIVPLIIYKIKNTIRKSGETVFLFTLSSLAMMELLPFMQSNYSIYLLPVFLFILIYLLKSLLKTKDHLHLLTYSIIFIIFSFFLLSFKMRLSMRFFDGFFTYLIIFMLYIFLIIRQIKFKDFSNI